jgi:hypothetical protein
LCVVDCTKYFGLVLAGRSLAGVRWLLYVNQTSPPLKPPFHQNPHLPIPPFPPCPASLPTPSQTTPQPPF